ncbi:MAG: sugar transferase [Hyphomonadaceae bacterium]|nr:sugar transferase [Hyphomonadaceae bacterium]
MGVSSVALIVLSLVMALVWGLVVTTSKGPAIFWSTRVGRDGRHFRMPKFRTLRQGAALKPREALGVVEFEFTPVGKFLRRTGLDELPQLFSVLKGDMSLIGPRPLLASDPGARERTKFPAALSVRPGISGLAQVNGRNQVSPRRKARLDALYARSVSLRADLALMAKTVRVIVSGKGFV